MSDLKCRVLGMELTLSGIAFTMPAMETDEVILGAKRGPGKTREMVKRWAEKGLNGAEIARKVGISRQAANGHLRALRDAGELPEASEPI
jgi:DNA-binding transcriptional ArsR family regulator